jgi:hypothetical protein
MDIVADRGIFTQKFRIGAGIGMTITASRWRGDHGDTHLTTCR